MPAEKALDGGRPAFCVDRPRGVGDEAHAPVVLGDHLPSLEGLGRHRTGLYAGIGRLGGPPGFDPPDLYVQQLSPLGWSATQLRKKAAQFACLAVAAMP